MQNRNAAAVRCNALFGADLLSEDAAPPTFLALWLVKDFGTFLTGAYRVLRNREFSAAVAASHRRQRIAGHDDNLRLALRTNENHLKHSRRTISSAAAA